MCGKGRVNNLRDWKDNILWLCQGISLLIISLYHRLLIPSALKSCLYSLFITQPFSRISHTVTVIVMLNHFSLIISDAQSKSATQGRKTSWIGEYKQKPLYDNFSKLIVQSSSKFHVISLLCSSFTSTACFSTLHFALLPFFRHACLPTRHTISQLNKVRT